jgi:hypothetical protein
MIAYGMQTEDKQVIEHIYTPLDDEDYSAQGDDDFVLKFMTTNTKEPI